MPRKALPASVFSSSPCHLRCLAVLTAAWGSCGFRATPSHRHLVSTADASTSGSYVGGDIYRRGARKAGANAVAFSSNGHRRRPLSTGGGRLGCSTDAAAAGDSGDVEAAAAATISSAAAAAGAAATATIKVEERVWLGNGPDPMANTGQIRPGTSDSLAAVASGRDRGHGIATEEMWLNGPFKAPLPPEPLVSDACERGG